MHNIIEIGFSITALLLANSKQSSNHISPLYFAN